jgi:hypothetical protein
VSDCTHFPVQDADYVRQRLVEYDVVDFVVAVDEGCAVFWLGRWVGEERYHFVLVRDLADWDARLFVFGGGLGVGDCVEGGDLAVVEARGLAVRGEVDGGGGYAVEFCERGYGGMPPGWCC